MRHLTRLQILSRTCCDPPSARLSDDEAASYASLFKALADETRVQIVRLLADQSEPLCACSVESAFDLSQPTISHHLKILRDAGLVTTERRGVWIYYALNRDRVAALQSLITGEITPKIGENG